ncbi:MAG: hypothetical protein JXA96_05220 [Sedimentisphaerales bacterium]|nr:hypothetical protein [Sedimentisphaerales bacterium]
MPTLFRAIRQPRLGQIPQSQELHWAINGMDKVIMKDLVPIYKTEENH